MKTLLAFAATSTLLAMASGCAHNAPTAALPEKASGTAIDGKAAFVQLKKLAGKWSGPTGSADGPAAQVHWTVTAGGSAVMETQFPGTPHEMVSVYHLDGDQLVLTHYCAAQNQPKMKLRSASSNEMIFEFAGGTGFDPAKDGHIHEGAIRLKSDRAYEADWTMFQNGKAQQTMKFFMQRTAGASGSSARYIAVTGNSGIPVA